jgi:hypothetical protein
MLADESKAVAQREALVWPLPDRRFKRRLGDGDALDWALITRADIDATIETLTKNGRQKEAAKWRNLRNWFWGKVRNSWPGGSLEHE